MNIKKQNYYWYLLPVLFWQLLLKFEKELASTVDILSNERTQSTELAEQREKQVLIN